MADAEDSKSSARKGVRVRLPPPAPLRISRVSARVFLWQGMVGLRVNRQGVIANSRCLRIQNRR